jgi:DNA repair protein RecO (recombination protein O)
MQWADDAIVLGLRRHGETSVILEVMTPMHGRCLGLVRGGRSKRMQPILQPGNSLAITWRARLEEHLGQFSIEPVMLRAADHLHDPFALNALLLLASHLRLLPERDPHEGLYQAFLLILDHLSDRLVTSALVARFELALLSELGFGLDLSACAATGAMQDLAYVSPKSGRAVSRQAGLPYADRLLDLPDFLREGALLATPDADAIHSGLALTGFFLNRHLYEPRGLAMPDARHRMVSAGLV